MVSCYGSPICCTAISLTIECHHDSRPRSYTALLGADAVDDPVMLKLLSEAIAGFPEDPQDLIIDNVRRLLGKLTKRMRR